MSAYALHSKKDPNRSSVALKTMALLLAMAVSFFICSTSLKEMNTYRRFKLQVIHVYRPDPATYDRGECADTPVRLFAIISMQRSGSGWFETLINSHPNVSSHGEIFSVGRRRSNGGSIVRTLDRVYNLDWFTSASKNECSAAVGFKWMLNQGVMENRKEIRDYFRKRGVSVIFLFRRNLLRRMVSLLANSYDQRAKLLNGTHKSHVHTLEEARTLAEYKPVINTSSLVSDLRNVEGAIAAALREFGSTKHIVLFYEDVVRNPNVSTDWGFVDREMNWGALQLLRDVQGFLGLPVVRLTSRQVKIHNGALSQHVANWEDVRAALRATEFEKFLDSD